MSIFNWFSSKSASPPSSSLPSDGLTVTPPASVMPTRSNVLAPSLKVKRQDRRDQLYRVVRDVMLRAEVLAASYKFKVLSLDTHGRQFLIMVDMLDPSTLPPHRFTELENLIISAAALQHDLSVKSVYWRWPSPLPASTIAVPVNSVGRVGAHRPIEQDEMLAFKKALAPAHVKPSSKVTGTLVTSGARYPEPDKGFEDTLILESETTISPLSNTQFGDL